MATDTMRGGAARPPHESLDAAQPLSFQRIGRFVLVSLGSLKLTVALLVMAIFIVLAGTMAQVNKGIWQVTDEYFRTAIAWIDISVFFPRHWFPSLPHIPGRLPFPGGWLIGLVMSVNLLAAHLTRFRIRARGIRLASGVALIVVGGLVTWLVVVSGSNKDDVAGLAQIDWSILRLGGKIGIGICWLVSLYALGRLDRARSVRWWSLAATVAGLGGLLTWWFFQGDRQLISDSSLRILWQLLKGGLASLILLGGSLLLFRKRGGVVLLHGGIALMMLGELLVGLQAVEGKMRIREGQTINYVEQDRTYELAIIDKSDPKVNDVMVLPATRLRPGTTIVTDTLPFDITVHRYFDNSVMQDAVPGEANRATHGTGLKWIAKKAPLESGTDDKVNLVSAYIELKQKGSNASLGTYLVSLLASHEGIVEHVHLDAKNLSQNHAGSPPRPGNDAVRSSFGTGTKMYDVSLRFKRIYKQYSMSLIDFRFDKYLGTTKAKNFSSKVRLIDPKRNVDRTIKIWMNNPLRYAGETFYQSGYESSDKGGTETTILHVVTNQGWMIPYVACMMVATGMLAHFWWILLRFLNRRASEMARRKEGSTDDRWRIGTPIRTFVAFPLIVLIGAAWLLLHAAFPPAVPEDQMDTTRFGQLPLAYEGRIKPFDTLARNTLTQISDKQTFVDGSGTRRSAIDWLLDVITRTSRAIDAPVFRIENLDLLDTLNLERRAGFRYSLAEIRNNKEEFYRQVNLASKRDKKQLSLYQRKILELNNKIRRYRLLEESFAATPIRQDHEAEDLAAGDERVRNLALFQPPLAVPAIAGSAEPWQTFASAWIEARRRILDGEKPNPATAALSGILASYVDGDADAFNRGVAGYQQALALHPPQHYDAAKTRFEAFFNQAGPFIWSAVLYLIAFILAAFAWLGFTVTLNRASFWLITFTLLVHTVAVIARIYISGRPPVTNLYSSAVFIGWGCVILGLVLEVIYRLGIGNIVASVTGFTSLLVAFFLSRKGDTFVVLQAVLDTQFWLATHVTCITLGYATTFMAGFLGLLYIVRGVFTRSLSPQVAKALSRMIYGTVCFSIFFSFVGTVLGGLWADDSWGRFWGWDPKENGALMIVLWNALVLHAHWDGMVRDRGMALLAVAGNLVTAWSWFGVNELGVGLHSYGFTEGVLLALGLFGLSQLAVIVVGLVPGQRWRSPQT
ncbi:MAG: cytochrome c biogenesis protein CcsA [Pirellulales bacterium]